MEQSEEALLPSAQDCDRVDCLVFLTFNAGLFQYKLFGITLFRNPPFTNRRVAHMPIALRTTEADVIALQEIFDENHAEYLIESLRLIYPYSARRTSGGMLATHNGLLILSKFPIRSTTFHPFKSITWIESFLGSKGVLEAVIDIPGMGSVCVLNMHMASGTVDPESTRLDEIRAEEMKEVLGIVQVAVDRGESPLILGDFNAAPTVCPTSYRMLLEAGWEDMLLSAARTPSQRRKRKRETSETRTTTSSTTQPSDAPFADSSQEPFDVAIDVNLSTMQHTSSDVSTLAGSHKLSHGMSSGCLDCEHWTWDPKNALNMLGPHANCHGLRCDHAFLPPVAQRGCLREFRATHAQILFDQPRVLIYSRWLKTCLMGPMGRCVARDGNSNTAPLLVTLSDHYAVKVVLERSLSEASQSGGVVIAGGLAEKIMMSEMNEGPA